MRCISTTLRASSTLVHWELCTSILWSVPTAAIVVIVIVTVTIPSYNLLHFIKQMDAYIIHTNKYTHYWHQRSTHTTHTHIYLLSFVPMLSYKYHKLLTECARALSRLRDCVPNSHSRFDSCTKHFALFIFFFFFLLVFVWAFACVWVCWE